MKLFGKLFGKSAREESGGARHRAGGPEEGGAQQAERPLFRDEVAGAEGAVARPLLTLPRPDA